MRETLEAVGAPERSGDALRVFISYSRADLAAAEAVADALVRNGFDVKIDVRDLPYGEEWQAELAGFIAGSDTVVWLVSPDSVRSRWVNWELGEVVRLSKRLVPVRVREVDADTLPEALGRINLLPNRGAYDPALHEQALVATLNTNRGWLRKGTSLAEAAAEWNATGRDGARLLRGKALKEAEAWSAAPPRDAPAPPSETLELILASRRAQRRGARRIVSGSIAAALIAIALAATAVWFGLRATEQAAEAERQRQAALTNEERALSQEAEANRQRQAAEENADRAERERQIALASEVDRVTSVAKPYLTSGRPDIALGFALDVAPRSLTDEIPLSRQLELVARRASAQAPAPVERLAVDNAFKLAVSADSRWIAVGTAGGRQGIVHIFDAETLTEKHRFLAIERDYVSGLAFSPDGASLAVAGGLTPGLWDVSTGKRRVALALPEGMGGFTKVVRFSPDGGYLVVTTNRNFALVYHGTTGELLAELPGQELESVKGPDNAMASPNDPIARSYQLTNLAMFGTTTDVAISADSSMIALAGPAAMDGSVQIFEAGTWELKKILSGGLESAFGGAQSQAEIVAFAPDGATIYASSLGTTIKAWDIQSGILKSESPAAGINTMMVTPDGRVIVAGHHDGTLTFRCMEGFIEIVSLQAHRGGINSITSDPKRRLMVTASSDGTAKVWRLPTALEACPDQASTDLDSLKAVQPLAVLAAGRGVTHSGLFMSGERFIITSSQDGGVRAWRPQDTTSIAVEGTAFAGEVPDFGEEDQLVIASPNGREVFVSGGIYEDFVVVDLASGSVTALPEVEAVSPAGPNGVPRLFASSTVYWEQGDTPRKLDDPFADPWRGPVASTGRRAIDMEPIEGSYDGIPVLVDVEAGKNIRRLEADGKIAQEFAVYFSPDGRLVFAGFERDGTSSADGLAVWDAESGEQKVFSPGLEGYSYANNHHLSKDGSVLLNEDSHGAQVFRFREGEILPVVVGGLGQRRGARALSADGETIYEAGENGTVAVLSVSGSGAPRILRVGEHALTFVDVSTDGRLLVTVDVGKTLTVMDAADGTVYRTLPLMADLLAVRFADNGSRLFLVDVNGGMAILPLLPGQEVADPHMFLDWLRAKRHSDVDTDDRAQFGLTSPAHHPRGDLDAIAAQSVPPIVSKAAPSDEAVECDRLAANPLDRERRSPGVVFDALQAEAALQICQRALAISPDDRQTIYQVARVHDRLGHTKMAYEGYRTAADKGYAIAMRGIARLIEIDKTGELPEVGNASQWMARAAAAGDRWALAVEATESALQAPLGEASKEAFSKLAAAGVENRAEAAMILSTRLADMGDQPGAAERRHFYALLGLELFDTQNDAKPFSDLRTYEAVARFARDRGAEMPPDELVGLYRRARDWRAN